MTTDLAEIDSPAPVRTELPPEPQHPHPVRFRRLKRFAVITIAFVAVLLAARLWWGHEAARRLATEVDAIHARGEPILPGDFEPTEVPDAEDAVRAYWRAAGYATFSGPRATFQMRFEGTLPLTEADRRALAALLQSNAKAFQLARAARPLSRYGTLGFRSPVIATPGPSPSSRQLATVLLWRSLYAHDAGDDDEAIESVRDVLRVALAVEHESPTIVHDLVAGGLDTYALQTLSQITYDLRVEAGGAGTAGAATRPTVANGPTTVPAAARSAGRAQVKALIAELLDDEALRVAVVRSAWGERMLVFDAEPALIQSFPRPVRWPVRPALDLGTIRAIENRGQLVAAAREPDFPHAKGRLPAEDRSAKAAMPSRLEQAADVPLRVLGWSGEQWLATHFERLAQRRMAAVALAARLYRMDHGGAWPASLDELVPAYLPAVPVDPLAADGSRLRYVRDAPGWEVPPAALAAWGAVPPPPGAGPFIPGPIVYSVGRDGVDDGGSRQLNPNYRRPTQTFSFERTQWRDLVLPLSGNPEYRKDPPAPAADSDDSSSNPSGGDAASSHSAQGRAPADVPASQSSFQPTPASRPASP